MLVAAMAGALSVLAIAGSTWTALVSRGPRVAQVERSVAASVQTLAGRIDAVEVQVRATVSEAQDLFDRAQTQRRSTAAALSKTESALARAADSEADPPIPIDPAQRRAAELALVARRLALGNG